jgi:hypothetical protein
MDEPTRALHRIVWFDAIAGLVAGLAMALLVPWLEPVFGSPRGLLYAIAAANTAYGCFALSIARADALRLSRVRALAIANTAWTSVCAGLVVTQWDDATWLGLAWFAGEGVFVGVLGQVELRALGRARPA